MQKMIKMQKMSKRLKMPRTRVMLEVQPMPRFHGFNHERLFYHNGQGTKWGGGGGPPRGVSIRRPPKVCQRRARLISNWLCRITAGPSRHSFAQFGLKCSKPLSFPFPTGLGITGAQQQFCAFCVLLAHLGRFFRFPNRTRKLTSKKHRKKSEN